MRRANRGDVPELESVINEHWRVNINHRKELANPDAILLVAIDEHSPRRARGIVVGTALMWVTKWNKTGYLVKLAVTKEKQRMGIAKALVRNLVRQAKRKRLRAIIVETQPDNRSGMDFYLHNGFRLCGHNDRYYTNKPKTSHEIALFFSLDL